MNENLTEMIFVLDRSGSMEHLTQETIGGFNSLINKQKKDNETYVTTVLFDDYYELLHDHLPINSVPRLTDTEYYARGCTALLDAVGEADSIGIRPTMACRPTASAAGVKSSFKAVSKITDFLRSRSSDDLCKETFEAGCAEFLADIE